MDIGIWRERLEVAIVGACDAESMRRGRIQSTRVSLSLAFPRPTRQRRWIPFGQSAPDCDQPPRIPAAAPCLSWSKPFGLADPLSQRARHSVRIANVCRIRRHCCEIVRGLHTHLRRERRRVSTAWRAPSRRGRRSRSRTSARDRCSRRARGGAGVSDPCEAAHATEARHGCARRVEPTLARPWPRSGTARGTRETWALTPCTCVHHTSVVPGPLRTTPHEEREPC
jgi:hypothetical protein